MIRTLGVEFRMGETISSRDQIAELDSQFEAFFVGVGLGPAKRLDLPGSDMEVVVDAVKFIESYKRGLVDSVEGRVLVIGAGIRPSMLPSRPAVSAPLKCLFCLAVPKAKCQLSRSSMNTLSWKGLNFIGSSFRRR
jgi:hypothetical protein